MLRERLKPYFDILDPSEKKKAVRAVGHLIFIGDYMAYRELIRDLNPQAYELFYKEVRNIVKSSFECRKLWRTVLSVCSGHGSGSLLEESKRFNVDPRDVAFFWQKMSVADKSEVNKLALQENYYGILPKEEFDSIVKSLGKYCGKVSYLKLRFLSDNDHSLDLTDLKAELLVHAIQVVRLYEHCGDLNKIENFAKRGVSNHAVNLIQFHTSESRARVTNNTKGCGTCIFCLTDKPQKCKKAVADYSSTTVSMQALSASSDYLPAHEVVLSKHVDSDLHRDNFLSFMKDGVSDKTSKVLDLVINSDPDDEFEQWLSALHGVTVDSLLTNPRRLVRLLCSYLDVSHKEVTTTIRDRYTSYRKSI